MPQRVLHRLRKLSGLGAREWRDMLDAQIALLRAQRRVGQDAIGTIVTRRSAASIEATGDAARARALALALTRAADFGVFRPKCLVRVLALQEMLVAHDIRGGTVHVGVMHDRGKFMAHAWITWRGEILGDHPSHVARFTEVDDLRVLTAQ